jgi:hypothetical protein
LNGGFEKIAPKSFALEKLAPEITASNTHKVTVYSPLVCALTHAPRRHERRESRRVATISPSGRDVL